jgi:hypothetical protein
MTRPAAKAGKTRTYGAFAISAAIYASGVLAFSAWSYHQHRAIIMTHVDQSLFNAAYATEQILSRDFIERMADPREAMREEGYATQQARLDQLADDCRFEVLGAAVRQGTKTWWLVAGAGGNGPSPRSEMHYGNPLQPGLAAIILDLASSDRKDVHVQNLAHDDFGRLRMAVLYRAISADTGYALLVARNTSYVNGLMHAQAIRTLANGLFLLVMAYPMIALYNRARARAAREPAGNRMSKSKKPARPSSRTPSATSNASMPWWLAAKPASSN